MIRHISSALWLVLVPWACVVSPPPASPAAHIVACLAAFDDADVELVTKAWPGVELSCHHPDVTAYWAEREMGPLGLYRPPRTIVVSPRALEHSPHAVGLVLAHEVGHALGYEHAAPPCDCDLMCPAILNTADACIVEGLGHH